eukprot:CAMPEP_0181212260 /NCGR_PEP_ID=MMETSP1096-20121128/24251_1 /TAXON_ID=156174 ORGANISM="Chrysochromulina ericina, Strain CCMP281" /NCGR_SAMPLE_ID=MMETSP1096 /ASSEMBLY_ACC=CAM_ASM_000453 /LENGTH=57 /DNA_ID=CAMNT_0023303769 /DNA_START=415 /DNA_END=588 /DNA_ORIENTATION=+
MPPYLDDERLPDAARNGRNIVALFRVKEDRIACTHGMCYRLLISPGDKLAAAKAGGL